MSSIWTERFDNPVSAKLRDPASTGYAGLLLGVFAAFLAIPPIEARSIVWSILVGLVATMLGVWTASRGRAQARLRRRRRRADRDRARHPRHAVRHRQPRGRLQQRADRADVPVLDAARVRRDRGNVLRAQRRREHRPRGDDADGRVLGRLRRRRRRQLGGRAPRRSRGRRAAGAALRVLRDPSPRRPDRRRRRDQLPRARDHRLLLLPALPRHVHPERRLDDPEREASVDLGHDVPRPGDRRPQPDDLGELRARDRVVHRRLQDADRAAHSRVRRASARRRHGRDQRLRDSLRRASSFRGSSPRSAASTSRTGSAAARSPTT